MNIFDFMSAHPFLTFTLALIVGNTVCEVLRILFGRSRSKPVRGVFPKQ